MMHFRIRSSEDITQFFENVSVNPDINRRTRNRNVNVLDNSIFKGNVDWHGCSSISRITFRQNFMHQNRYFEVGASGYEKKKPQDMKGGGNEEG